MLYDLKKFPQKKRVFPAKTIRNLTLRIKKQKKVVLIILFTLTFSGIIAGIVQLLNPAFSSQSKKTLEEKKFETLKKKVLKDPVNPNIHIQLAKLYKEANNFEGASKELMLALKANPETSLYLQLFTNLKDIKQKPERTKEEIEHWEEITKENPGYRDAYFQIAILSYQIYKDQEALKAVNKALELDPNFESAKKLSQLLLP